MHFLDAIICSLLLILGKISMVEPVFQYICLCINSCSTYQQQAAAYIYNALIYYILKYIYIYIYIFIYISIYIYVYIYMYLYLCIMKHEWLNMESHYLVTCKYFLLLQTRTNVRGWGCKINRKYFQVTF